MSVIVTVEVAETPDPRAGRGVAWYRSQEATEAFTQGRHEIVMPLGHDLEVGVELTWRARERTERAIERLVATGDESDRVSVSAGTQAHRVRATVTGATPMGIPAGGGEAP
jgi:hypothetical protein